MHSNTSPTCVERLHNLNGKRPEKPNNLEIQSTQDLAPLSNNPHIVLKGVPWAALAAVDYMNYIILIVSL